MLVGWNQLKRYTKIAFVPSSAKNEFQVFQQQLESLLPENGSKEILKHIIWVIVNINK